MPGSAGLEGKAVVTPGAELGCWLLWGGMGATEATGGAKGLGDGTPGAAGGATGAAIGGAAGVGPAGAAGAVVGLLRAFRGLGMGRLFAIRSCWMGEPWKFRAAVTVP